MSHAMDRQSKHGPDEQGRYGAFGGQYIPEALTGTIRQLEEEYARAQKDPAFWTELNGLLKDYAGRPSPIYYARRLSEKLGGAKIYFKREDLNHTGSHKINNTLGQGLLTVRMGKKRVIAETGAGSHGVAVATAAAMLGLECTIFMGAEDTRRQALNVFRMELMGAEVVSVESGQKTLADAVNEALREWVTCTDTTHYLIGSVVGPHPFPMIVHEFQRVVGREAREQFFTTHGKLPDMVMACVGGGSNAVGIFDAFVNDSTVRLVGAEAAGDGVHSSRHAATLTKGSPGVLHGMYTYVLQDDNGGILPVHSVSAGLDYPGVGPIHSYWKDTGRAEYVAVTDSEAIEAFSMLSQMEGIIPALESSHAVAHAIKVAPTMSCDATILVNLSGRGDKDCVEVSQLLGKK